MADPNLTSPQTVVPTRPYRTFLIKLGRKLKKADLSELKFALRGTIPEGKLENLNDPLQLFIALEHLCLLGPDNFSTLRGCLQDIDRPNLIEMLDEYDSSRGELVEVRSDSKYSLTFVNHNNGRCNVNVEVNGFEMFTAGYSLLPKQTFTIERPIRIVDPQPGPGASKWRRDDRGDIEAIRDKTDIKITCVVTSDTEDTFQTLQTLHIMPASKYDSKAVYHQWERYYRVNEYPTYCTNYTDPVFIFEALIKETEGLINDYIGFRLRSRFEQSCLDGIPREILVPTSKPSYIKANVFRRVAMEFEDDFEWFLQEIGSRIDFSQSQAGLESTFHSFVKEAFSDNVINWGRIVAIITFTSMFAHHFVEQERPEMVCEVIQWLIQFIRVHLITWIIQNGGWDGFVVFFNGSESSLPELFPEWAITGFTFGIAGFTGRIIGMVLASR